MRSSMFKAALAAFLISTPLTMAFAASPYDHGGRTLETRHGRGHNDTTDGHLHVILNDLSQANVRIASDRSHGRITPAQAHHLRDEAASIRRNARADDKDGMIPMGQYRHLRAQVENLQSQL